MFHPAIPAYHQVLHLRISLRIHLLAGYVSGAEFHGRIQFASAR